MSKAVAKPLSTAVAQKGAGNSSKLRCVMPNPHDVDLPACFNVVGPMHQETIFEVVAASATSTSFDLTLSLLFTSFHLRFVTSPDPQRHPSGSNLGAACRLSLEVSQSEAVPGPFWDEGCMTHKSRRHERPECLSRALKIP